MLRQAIGENIAAQRVRADLTLDEVARSLDLAGRLVVWRWEAGLRMPDVETLVRLARVLGCKPARFFDGIE